MTNQVTKQLLTTSEVAELLRLSPSRVCELAAAGEIPAVRVSRKGHLRFRAADIEAMLSPRRAEES